MQQIIQQPKTSYNVWLLYNSHTLFDGVVEKKHLMHQMSMR